MFAFHAASRKDGYVRGVNRGSRVDTSFEERLERLYANRGFAVGDMTSYSNSCDLAMAKVGNTNPARERNASAERAIQCGSSLSC